MTAGTIASRSAYAALKYDTAGLPHPFGAVGAVDLIDVDIGGLLQPLCLATLSSAFSNGCVRNRGARGSGLLRAEANASCHQRHDCTAKPGR
ncbi:hypothetical protein LRC484719_34130 [Mycobacterium riyadhense]